MGIFAEPTGPTAHESGASFFPDVERVPFLVSHDSRRRDGADPARRSFPSLDRFSIVYGDPAILDNPAAALRLLPFECVAGQSLRRCALPNKTPEILVAFGALSA